MDDVSELLRLADENKRMRGIIETLDVEGHRCAERAEAELAAARETIKRLNRRVQVAEAGIAEKVKASAPGSLGRALANAAADKYMRERDMAQAELAALKARIADACPAQAVVDDREECGVRIWVDRSIGSNRTRLGELEGKRVRLLVDEPPAPPEPGSLDELRIERGGHK